MTSVIYHRNFPLGLAAMVFVFLAISGKWGSVGAGDGALYRQIAECADSSPGAETVKSCLYPRDTAALLPNLVLGLGARITGFGKPLRVLIRLFGVMMGLFVLMMVWDLADGRRYRVEGSVAMLALLVATPLVERARSGGVEVWLLAMLLVLSRLMAARRVSLRNSLAVLGTAVILIATHPYAAWVLLVCLFMPMVEAQPGSTAPCSGRVWFGWLGARYLAGAVGGLATFALIWPGFQTGPGLWRRLVGLFRLPHPPFRFGGEVWLQGLEGGPPFYATLGILVMSTSVAAVALILLGIFRSGRGGAFSLSPLMLLALAWLTINSLQGSPYADGYDHRLVILGLFIPFTGRGFSTFEDCCARIIPRRPRIWAVAVGAVVLGMSLNIVDAVQGRPPSSGFAADSGAVVGLGGPAFGRPVFEPELLGVMESLPANTKLACSPWETICRTEIVPGIAKLGFGRVRAARLFGGDMIVIPNDPAYVSPPVMLRDFSGDAYAGSEIYDGAWLRYAVKRTRPGGTGGPSPSPPR